ncbi:metal transporter [Sphingopyxis sp. H071]|nr:metal transporter [Sphingopyxis sp. H057]KTE50820.1 metal transporter [Sphingopyxis sp. H073]KTE51805.1 metal transporter [Sphingopyxis sp. H071]KTE58399.1 metal transporter [Sphingopyxis sp. H107]KTE64371.1 metal transporter [Sphingopyxis sp. H100]KTE72959.1 metal transporter [Sphingopyxis sp. H081]KTE79403.1 metal transporter [Sphingopyxis sp. H067]
MFCFHRARSGARAVRRVMLCGGALLAAAAQPAWAQTLNLDEALSRVATSDPALAANSARLDAADAAILQADVRPRDVLGADFEDFAGTGPYSPLGRAQTTGWYERTWERGGKREARIGAARAEVAVVGAQNRIRLLDRLARVQAAWVEALAAEAAIPVAETRLADLRQVELDVVKRVAGALDPWFTAERARTNVAQAEIAVEQAREAARIARTSLAVWWGGSGDFKLDPAAFQAFDVTVPPRADAADVAVLTAELAAAEAKVRLAETGNIADPSARVGLRHFGDGNDLAVMVGGSIPLGSKGANRGNVVRAQADQRAIAADMAVARVEIEREIDRILADRGLIAAEIKRIDAEVLPSATRAVRLIRDGLVRGGTAFTFLEYSQAQTALSDVRSRRVELLRRFHLLGVRLDRLTGRHTPLLAQMETIR